MKKITIIGVVLAVLAAVAWFFVGGAGGQQVSKVDAIDTVKSFYDQWLVAVKDPNVVPDRTTLAKEPILSKTLREKIADALKASDENLDPVLCQTLVPESISIRSVYESEEGAQILVTSKDKTVTNQAIVTLARLNDGWYINDIQCSLGEFAPEREFTFENEGFILKGSIPAPYDSKNWHIVFEQNGVPGHVAPLFFDSSSQCTDMKGTKSVCKPEDFIEASKVLVRGQMTERGATVNQLEFIK